jgi:hypothetical protein
MEFMPFLADAVAGEELLVRGAALAAGLYLFWVMTRAVVWGMLVPRPKHQKMVRWIARAVHVLFRGMAHRARNYAQLDQCLAAQGPSSGLVYLALTFLIFVGVFGLLEYGLTGCAPMEALYRAGSSLTTVGVVNASGFLALTVMFVAAFTGSIIIAVFIGFLLTFYSAYTVRESYMTKISLLVGEPGWGPEMVARLHRLQTAWSDGEVSRCVDWICTMRMNQYIFPLLNHFRSPVRDRHWTVTLLAIMDGVALQATVIEGKLSTSAARLLAQGAQAFRLLRGIEVYRTASTEVESSMGSWLIEEQMMGAQPSGAVPDSGIQRADWDQAMNFLAAQGVPLLADRESSWRAFSRIRSCYFEPAYFLAKHLSAVNAPWSGQRHPAFDFPRAWPDLARRFFT